MEYHVGVTGSRDGATERQLEVVSLILDGIVMANPDADVILHHGDCVGFDSQMHDQAVIRGWHVVIHPPTNDKYRAFRTEDPAATVLPAKDYHSRNRDIVSASDVVVGAPAPTSRGTKYTLDYAMNVGKRVASITSDGTLDLFLKTEEGDKICA